MKVEKPDFDRVTRGPDSKNLRASKVKWDLMEDEDKLDTPELKAEDVNNSRDVYNPHYEETMLEESVKEKKEISKQDKITFNVLKWIFTAIQVDDTVERDDLLFQLSKNDDIIEVLGFKGMEEVRERIYDLRTEILGFLNWEEFLDFFLSHAATLEELSNPWWKEMIKPGDNVEDV